MKKCIALFLFLILMIASPGVAADGVIQAVDDQIHAEFQVETGTVREVDGKFIFAGQIQVSFYDPAGFEVSDVKAAVLSYRNNQSDSEQIVPLHKSTKGNYQADILLTQKGDLHLLVSMVLNSGEKKYFDFHYAI